MDRIFERILVVMFENQFRSYAMRDAFLRKLAMAGADMRNYFGCFHPSQTNYLASLAGEVCGVSNDEVPMTPLRQRTVVDLLEEQALDWNAYMEGYPMQPWDPAWQNPDAPPDTQPLAFHPDGNGRLPRYFRKHNAFASFHNIQADPGRWSRIVDERRFWNDVNAEPSGLPCYSWFVPDIWNDGHYLHNTQIETNPRTRLIPQLANWLQYQFLGNLDATDVQCHGEPGTAPLGLNLDIDLLIADPQLAWQQSRVPPGTLIVITFDEADYNATGYDTNYDGPNQIYTVLLGDMIEPGTVVETPLNHYSLLRTVQKNFALGSLRKNDRGANWFRFLWGQRFHWSPPAATGLLSHRHLALAMLDGRAFLVADAADGRLLMSRCEGSDWQPPQATGLSSAGPLAMASVDDSLFLLVTDEDGTMSVAVHRPEDGWQQPQPLGLNTSGSVAMTAYHDVADDRTRLMLCWTTGSGFIRYRICSDGHWGPPGAVGQLTDGPMTLAQLGASLYLVYKERNTCKLRMTSFNVAPFNAFKARSFDGSPVPGNDTSLHQWSPADWPVGHFCGKQAVLQNSYQCGGKPAMAAIEGELHLIHRGAYQDTPSAYGEVFGLTGIFTAADQRTNGHGTIQQAGWTPERECPAFQLDPDSPLALASDGDRLLLAWRGTGGASVLSSSGGYHG